MNLVIRLLICLFVAQVLLGCASNQTQGKQIPLRFIAAVEISREATERGIPIGGLSSATYDSQTGELLSISDDTGYVSGPRIHHFDVTVTESSLSVISKTLTNLTNSDGSQLQPERLIDGEALVKMPSGNFLVASEGMDVKGFFELPALIEFSSEGKYIRDWIVPKKFMPLGKKMVGFGVRPNDAFESLALTPDKATVFMANEKAMFQDGKVPDLNTESPIRVLEYRVSEKVNGPIAEYAYHVSPLKQFNGDTQTTGFRSLSDFMALDNKHLIFLEKTFFTKPVMKNSVQLYLGEKTSETTNVADYSGLADKIYVPMKKKLWIDLDQFEGQENFPNLDNVEGITLGPDLPNGNKTLILLTDNNFSKRQKTLIYAFEILTLKP